MSGASNCILKISRFAYTTPKTFLAQLENVLFCLQKKKKNIIHFIVQDPHSLNTTPASWDKAILQKSKLEVDLIKHS